jgi:hypothetical protein
MCKHRTNGNRAVQDLSSTKEDGYEILGRLHLLLREHTRFLRLELFLIIFGTLQLSLPCNITNGWQSHVQL